MCVSFGMNVLSHIIRIGPETAKNLKKSRFVISGSGVGEVAGYYFKVCPFPSTSSPIHFSLIILKCEPLIF